MWRSRDAHDPSLLARSPVKGETVMLNGGEERGREGGETKGVCTQRMQTENNQRIRGAEEIRLGLIRTKDVGCRKISFSR